MKESQKFCRNSEQIARAFGLPLSPRKRKGSLATVAGWIGTADFPAKQRHGWVLEEVRKWKADKKKAEMLNAEKLKAEMGKAELANGFQAELIPPPIRERIAFLADLYCFPEKHPDRKISQWEKEELREYRPDLFKSENGKLTAENTENAKGEPPGASGGPPQGGTMYDGAGRLLDCESQESLAMRLAAHFAGRTSIDISPQQISKWKRSAEDLPAGTAPPPPKLGNRWPTQAWADWFEKFMLPHYRYAPKTQGTLPGTDLATQAREAELREKIYKGQMTEIQFRATTGEYVPMAKARLARRGALKLQHGIFRRALEQEDCRARQEWLASRLSAADLLLWVEFDKALARARVDFVEGEYGRALAMEPEREMAKTENKS